MPKRLATLATLAACLCLPATGSMGAERSDAVDARISSSAIVIVNRADQPVCYAIHEADVLARIEWGPECSEKNLVPPRQSVRIPFVPSDYRPSGEAVISWWFAGRPVVERQIRLQVAGRATGRP